jgi:hypothetical protein
MEEEPSAMSETRVYKNHDTYIHAQNESPQEGIDKDHTYTYICMHAFIEEEPSAMKEGISKDH